MKDSRLPALIFLLMVVLASLQWVQVYPQLPERVASHFAANGRPNGWQSKQDFFVIPCLAILVSAFVAFVLPRTLAFVPQELINLPNKSYWLAQERRAKTVRVMCAHMAWFSCGLLFVLLYAISQAISANLPTSGHFNSNGMWYVIGGFSLFGVGLLVHMTRYFYKAPPDYSALNSSPK